MKHLSILFLLSFTLLYASYPKAFSSMGTPLYKANKKFSQLPKQKLYSPKVLSFHQMQEDTRKLSLGDKKAYLKALRTLSKEHDVIISMVKREMLNSINYDDILSFQALNEAELNVIYKQESLKIEIYNYYLKNTDRYFSTYLNKKIRAEKGYEKRYGVDVSNKSISDTTKTSTHHQRQNRLILLSTTWCGQCKKAKAYLRENGIKFTEYDAEKSTKGKSLMKKYQGTGYPTFIIGDESMSGLSPSWIKERL